MRLCHAAGAFRFGPLRGHLGELINRGDERPKTRDAVVASATTRRSSLKPIIGPGHISTHSVGLLVADL